MQGTPERMLRYYLFAMGGISEIEGIGFTRWHKATRDGTEEGEASYEAFLSQAGTWLNGYLRGMRDFENEETIIDEDDLIDFSRSGISG